jgi:hypothetical protein
VRRPVAATVAAALTITIAASTLTGCARGLTRDQLRAGYRDELVRIGVPEALASCVTDKFFAAMDDDELRAFQRRDRLTDDETARTTAYAGECAGSAG